ncbi:MAG: hypothetical protein AAFO79_06530 [Pseudomonadota bacterium]
MDLAAADKDPSGGQLRYTMLQAPRLGRAQLSPTGQLTYVQDLARPLTGSIQVLYRVDSPSGGAAIGAAVVDRSNCSHELAYAAQVDTAIAGMLGEDAEATSKRLQGLVEVCAPDPSALEVAMLSGALRAFGKPSEAADLLTKATFEPQPLALAQARTKLSGSTLQGAEFSAMVLAALVSADAPRGAVEAVSQRLFTGTDTVGGRRALTAAAKFWLARAALVVQASHEARDAGDEKAQALQLRVTPDQAHDRDTVLENGAQRMRTNFFSRAELASRGRPVITITNAGRKDAIGTLIMRGLPSSAGASAQAATDGQRAASAGSAAKLTVSRRFFRNVGGRLRELKMPSAGEANAAGQDGAESAPPTIALNELVFVLLEARVDAKVSKSSVLVDILPSGFDIVTPDLLSAAAPEGALDPRAFMGGPRGVLRFAEGRGDRFVALVVPGDDKASAGGPNVRVAYAARATVAGELALPATLLEDEVDPAIAARHASASKLTVALPTAGQ